MTFVAEGGAHDWAGGRTGPGYALASNILTGPEVVVGMENAWLRNHDVKFADRLLLALAAGDNAGGDKSGRLRRTFRH